MSVPTATIAPRAVTDDEVKFFLENGWVKLDQLISEEQAGILLARLKTYVGDDASFTERPGPGGGVSDSFHMFAPISVRQPGGEARDDLFYGYSHSREMGELAKRMLGTSVRYWVDDSLIKMPTGSEGSGATHWHQDIGAVAQSPYDPPIQLNCWLSLAHNTPSHGTMRFVADKDLSEEVRQIVKDHSVEESIPMLEALGVISPAFTMRPGDASLHNASTLHGAPSNATSEPRWAHDMTMMPVDTRFSGTHFWPSENVEGVEVGKPFPDHRFPVLA